MTKELQVIDAIVTEVADAIKDQSASQQVAVITAMCRLDPSVCESTAFINWAKTDALAPLVESNGVKVSYFEGHAVALGKGGEKLAEAECAAGSLRTLFSVLGSAMDRSIKSGKVDGASVAIQLTVK
jgi:hypothetical protein